MPPRHTRFQNPRTPRAPPNDNIPISPTPDNRRRKPPTSSSIGRNTNSRGQTRTPHGQTPRNGIHSGPADGNTAGNPAQDDITCARVPNHRASPAPRRARSTASGSQRDSPDACPADPATSSPHAPVRASHPPTHHTPSARTSHKKSPPAGRSETARTTCERRRPQPPARPEDSGSGHRHIPLPG